MIGDAGRRKSAARIAILRRLGCHKEHPRGVCSIHEYCLHALKCGEVSAACMITAYRRSFCWSQWPKKVTAKQSTGWEYGIETNWVAGENRWLLSGFLRRLNMVL